MTPTARSLRYCRENGILAEVVERWNQHSRTRHDMFGFVDILALEQGPLAIQATSASNVSSRVAKILAEPRAEEWLRHGGRIEVWGWGKRKVKRGGKAVRWCLSRRPVTAEHFKSPPADAD